MFYFDNINGRKILKSDLLKDVNHFFTTRETIIKTKDTAMQSLIAENKKIICDYLHIRELISPEQTHSANIQFAKNGQKDYQDTDALILTNTKQAIFLNFADCTPIILYDQRQRIVAISHAGWRGTAQRIAPKTINKMKSNPKDIVAIIGPTISICCYKVGEDVFNLLKTTVNNFDDLHKNMYVDLKGINARQLQEIGVKNIDICPYCTSCNNDLFFSYRKENGTTNRHSAVVCLNQ